MDRFVLHSHIWGISGKSFTYKTEVFTVTANKKDNSQEMQQQENLYLDKNKKRNLDE